VREDAAEAFVATVVAPEGLVAVLDADSGVVEFPLELLAVGVGVGAGVGAGVCGVLPVGVCEPPDPWWLP
jgi:hypothetical protein